MQRSQHWGSGPRWPLPLLLLALVLRAQAQSPPTLELTQLRTYPRMTVFGEECFGATDSAVSDAASALLQSRHTTGARLQLTEAELPEVFVFVVDGSTMAAIHPAARALFGIFRARLRRPSGEEWYQGPALVVAPIPGHQREYEQAVLHEFTHAVVFHLSAFEGRPTCPVWLDEGLAEWCSRDRGEIAREVSAHEHDMQDRYWRQHYIPPTALQPVHFAYIEREYTYRTALAFTDFLMSRGGTPAMRGLLRDLGRGRSVDEAFQRAQRTDLAALERTFSD